MNFESKHEGEVNWGCPRFSKDAGQWLIDWYDARGNLTGASVMQNGDACFCAAKPDLVAETQAQVATWLKGLKA